MCLLMLRQDERKDGGKKENGKVTRETEKRRGKGKGITAGKTGKQNNLPLPNNP
jgi:hypothetical protein